MQIKLSVKEVDDILDELVPQLRIAVKNVLVAQGLMDDGKGNPFNLEEEVKEHVKKFQPVGGVIDGGQ